MVSGLLILTNIFPWLSADFAISSCPSQFVHSVLRKAYGFEMGTESLCFKRSCGGFKRVLELIRVREICLGQGTVGCERSQ